MLDPMNMGWFFDYVIRKHAGQKRDEGMMYASHPFMVALIMAKYTFSSFYIATALGHDLLEDTDATYDEISDMTCNSVAYAIRVLTKRKGMRLHDYYDAISKNDIACAVKVADRIHNLETMASGGWNYKRQRAYIDKTIKYIVPLLLHRAVVNAGSSEGQLYRRLVSTLSAWNEQNNVKKR